MQTETEKCAIQTLTCLGITAIGIVLLIGISLSLGIAYTAMRGDWHSYDNTTKSYCHKGGDTGDYTDCGLTGVLAVVIIGLTICLLLMVDIAIKYCIRRYCCIVPVESARPESYQPQNDVL